MSRGGRRKRDLKLHRWTESSEYKRQPEKRGRDKIARNAREDGYSHLETASKTKYDYRGEYQEIWEQQCRKSTNLPIPKLQDLARLRDLEHQLEGTKDLQQEPEQPATIYPLMTKARGQTQYVPWSFLNMVRVPINGLPSWRKVRPTYSWNWETLKLCLCMSQESRKQ